MNTAIELHRRVQIADDCREDFIALHKEAAPLYEKPGGIRVRLLEDPAQSGGAVEVFEYATEHDYHKDVERSRNDAQMQKLHKRWQELLGGPPLIEVYRRVTP